MLPMPFAAANFSARPGARSTQATIAAFRDRGEFLDMVAGDAAGAEKKKPVHGPQRRPWFAVGVEARALLDDFLLGRPIGTFGAW